MKKGNRKRKTRKRSKNRSQHFDFIAVVSHAESDALQWTASRVASRFMGNYVATYETPFKGAIRKLKKRRPIMIYVCARSEEINLVCNFLTSLAATPKLAQIPYIVIMPDAKGCFDQRSFASTSALLPSV